MRYFLNFGAAALILCLATPGALQAQRNPFYDDGGPIQSPALTKKRADCQARYDTQMRISEQHYGRLLKEQKDIIEARHREVTVIKAQKYISAAMAAVVRLKESQMNIAAQEHNRLRIERLKMEAKFKQQLKECLLKAKQ